MSACWLQAECIFCQSLNDIFPTLFLTDIDTPGDIFIGAFISDT